MGPMSSHWASGQGGPWGAHGSAAVAAAAAQSMAQHMSSAGFNHPLYVHPIMQGHHQIAAGFPGGQSPAVGQKVSPVMILQRGQGHSPNSSHQGGGNFYQGKNQKWPVVCCLYFYKYTSRFCDIQVFVSVDIAMLKQLVTWTTFK